MSKNRIPGSTDVASETGRRRRLSSVNRMARIVIGSYVGIAILITVFQRHLIYQPSRSDSIHVKESGISESHISHVTVTAHDDIVLNGWRAIPDAPTARCVILYFHGNAGDRKSRRRSLRVLRDLGCEVWLMDYRGYGENAGSPNESDIARDSRSTWKSMTDHYGIAPERIVIYGRSLGGAVAVRLASELCLEGTPPGGIVMMSTFSSMVDAAGHHYPWLPVDWLLEERWASITGIRDVTCPLMHMHGTRDSIVPAVLGKKLFDAAPDRSASGLKKQFVELPECGHNDILNKAEADVTRSIDEFLIRAFARETGSK